MRLAEVVPYTSAIFSFSNVIIELQIRLQYPAVLEVCIVIMLDM